MKSLEADKFFRALAKRLDEPVTVFLTGAVAGTIFGNVRSSADIDFAIEPKRKGNDLWEKINRALLLTSSEICISVQYARDIDRWGMISLLDYRRKAILYKKFGTIDVRTLDPVYWAIGKFTRYLKPDIQDLVIVLKKKKVPSAKLTKTLGKALRQSPPSSQGFQFRQHVEQFLGEYGRKIWGAKFDPAASIRTFHKQAGISL
ncbi:MAG: hypothetical protein Q7J69_04160 [Candidatus Omnitrophota bacterium]|nr:hypothetical protein [Candidatus Omnitrophota bacterium]